MIHLFAYCCHAAKFCAKVQKLENYQSYPFFLLFSIILCTFAVRKKSVQQEDTSEPPHNIT